MSKGKLCETERACLWTRGKTESAVTPVFSTMSTSMSSAKGQRYSLK